MGMPRPCCWRTVVVVVAMILTVLRRTIAPIHGWIHAPLRARPSSVGCRSTTLLRLLGSSSNDQENTVFVDEEAATATDATSSFEGLNLHPVLLERIRDLGLHTPTAVQSATLQAFSGGQDLIVGSETGSGKTYAYLLPLLNDILQRREEAKAATGVARGINRPYDYARALVLVPNKELVQQVVRMALPLAGGPAALLTSLAAASATWSSSRTPTPRAEEKEDPDAFDALIRLAVVPGGLNEPEDFRPIREAMAGTAPPPDLLFATPAAFATLGIKPKHIGLFADIETLIVDEADLCVDGGYVRLVEQVLLGFKRADRLCRDGSVGADPGDRRNSNDGTEPGNGGTTGGLVLRAPRPTQHVFVAATLPNYGLKSVDRWIDRRFPRAVRVQLPDMHRPRHSGLTQVTEWRCVESKRERLRQLVELLQGDGALLANDKTMVFCNSVNDADGAAEALRLAGVSAAAYHAKLQPAERTAALERFRNDGGSSAYDAAEDDEGAEVSGVLVCTDLAGRGLDVPNVTAVVQLQFAGNAVAHLHRMGRCGRTGSSRPGGRGVIFYSESERELVQVLQCAEREQEQLALPGDVQDQDDLSSLDDDDDLKALDHGREDASDELRERGTVERAFSRKRGFTKKRKKLRSSDE